jgi:hypothetical protein
MGMGHGSQDRGMIYTHTAGENQRTPDAGKVQTYLATQGIVADIEVAIAPDGTHTYTIDTAATLAQLQTAMQSFVPAKTPRELLFDRMAATYPKLRDGSATARESQIALADLMLVVRELAGA